MNKKDTSKSTIFYILVYVLGFSVIGNAYLLQGTGIGNVLDVIAVFFAVFLIGLPLVTLYKNMGLLS